MKVARKDFPPDPHAGFACVRYSLPGGFHVRSTPEGVMVQSERPLSAREAARLKEVMTLAEENHVALKTGKAPVITDALDWLDNTDARRDPAAKE
jgi:hypothetical protein